jgi:serine/threonine-protein kinase
VLQKLLLHQSEPPPDVRALRSDVPDSLAGVIARMLAKRPEERFQNPPELAAALLSCAEQVGMATPQIALPAYHLAPPVKQTAWRRHAPWIVPIVLLILSVLALGLKWNSEATPPAFPELQISETMAPAKSQPQ